MVELKRDNGLCIFIQSNRLNFGAYDASGGSGDQITLQSADISANTWHHVAMVWSTISLTSGTLTCYVDGVQVATETSTALDLQFLQYFNSSDIMIGAVRGVVRFVTGTTTATSVSDTSPPLQKGFTGYIDDVRIYSTAITADQVAFLHSEALGERVRKPGFKFNPTTEEIQLNSKNFFLGNQASQFISGSNGLLEISSSNFHVNSEGQITASSMNLKGISVVEDVAVADYFAYRNVSIDQNNYSQ